VAGKRIENKETVDVGAKRPDNDNRDLYHINLSSRDTEQVSLMRQTDDMHHCTASTALIAL